VPLIDCGYVLHEKGLVILSEKLGRVLLFFADME